MSKDRSEKDVVIEAYPDQHKIIVVEMNDADVMSIVRKITGSVNDTKISEKHVNEFLTMIREQNLSYSFKLGQSKIEEVVLGD